MTKPEAVHLDCINFSYGNGAILRKLSLTAHEAEIVGILGPNGAGKSTTLRLIIGTLQPSQGLVEIFGLPLDSYTHRKLAQNIAMVPQGMQVSFNFSVRELVLMGRTPHGNWFNAEKKQDAKIVNHAIEDVGLSGFQHRTYRDLSGGEKQLVALAMALAQEPRILLLDEPTHNLDIDHQVRFITLLKQINESRNMTIIAVGHDVNLAALYCDRIILLRNGHIIDSGPPNEVINIKNMRACYGTDVHIFTHKNTGRPQISLSTTNKLNNNKEPHNE